MKLRRSLHITLPSLVSLVSVSACHPDAPDERVHSTVQEVRAGTGQGGDDVLIGMDVLLTDSEGQSVPCEEALVDVSVEISRNGEEGPWVEVGSDVLTTSCGSTRAGDLALVLDNSGSIEEQLDVVREGARRAANRVVGDGGRVSLVRVSTDSSVKSELTSDADELASRVDDLFVNKGWTALWDGVRMGNETLALDAEPVSEVTTHDGVETFCSTMRKQGVAVFTDGKENNSSHQKLRNDKYPGDGIDTTLDDLFNLSSAGARTPLYTIGLGNKIDSSALSKLATETGGRFFELEDLDQVDDVLEMISEYFSAAHRTCVEVPSHLCGSLDLRISHHTSARDQQTEGVSLHHIELPCDARVAGRIATILLTLDAAEISQESQFKLVANTVNWVSPVDAPTVLFVLDDFHHNEFSNDTRQLYDRLAEAGYAARYLDEPEAGLRPADLEGVDVVWFSNPGYPMDDEQSFNTLRRFSETGGGVVLQGDDMSYSFGQSFTTTPLTRLSHIDNGVKYCGVNIDNLTGGRYEVTFNQQRHAAIEGLEGQSFLYGDDIDSTTPIDERTEVLAWATTQGVAGCALKPVITVFDPSF